MQVNAYKSEVEQLTFSFLLCEEVFIIINCICEPRIGSEANGEAFTGGFPSSDSQANIMR